MRIINTKSSKTCKQLLLYINRNENGEDYLQLVAWHETKDGPMIQLGEIDLTNMAGADNIKMLHRLMYDFSELSANEFVNSFRP